MRVVHVPFGYYPDPVGGTEVYVAELVHALRRHGIESAVAAPALGGESSVYSHGGADVYRFAVEPTRNVADLYGEGDVAAAAEVDRVLAATRADVLHLHAFTSAASLNALRAARRRGVAVAFTYHTPTSSCVRGTLLRDGHVPCDGELLEHRCASCLLESRGAGDAVRAVLSRVPTILGSTVAASGATGSWVTALRARELTRARHDAFRRLLQEADAVIAVCEWVQSLLLRAGAEPSRVVLSRQGTPAFARDRCISTVERAARRDATDALRLAFAGRLHPTKGVHMAVKALASQPQTRATLDVYGVAQDGEARRYMGELESLAAGDPRVRFLPPVPSASVVPTLAAYDATVVPSQWLETGPLTVLESFAAGVPVLGSDLGGIAELVTHGRDGWLVPYGNVAAWASAMERLATDRALVTQLAAGVRPPRSMDDVARDIAAIYERIVPRRAEAAPSDGIRSASVATSGAV
jgi:glycosyltransferase involved in cell wall biosynthesis